MTEEIVDLHPGFVFDGTKKKIRNPLTGECAIVQMNGEFGVDARMDVWELDGTYMGYYDHEAAKLNPPDEEGIRKVHFVPAD